MMKLILTALLVSMPIGAQAMGMYGYGRNYAPGITVHLTTVLYSLLAALGYWVLQHAAKEKINYAKRAGEVVGWVLIAAGLAGLLCGLTAHVRSATCPSHAREGRMMMQREGMPGMPENMEVMIKMKGNREMKSAPEGKTAPAKKSESAPAAK